MLIIQTDSNGNFKDLLGGSNDVEFAEWKFNKNAKEGDEIKTIDDAEWERIAADERYKLACQKAAETLIT